MGDSLLAAVTRFTEQQVGDSPYSTAIEGLYILRSMRQKQPRHMIFRPSICIIVQGAKRTIFGDLRFDYKAGQALLVSLNMPAFSRVTSASPSEPYLGIILPMDPAVMQDVIASLDTPPEAGGDLGRGILLTDFDGPLADCALRMVQLMHKPQAITALYPAIMRELCYHLITGPQGAEVVKMMQKNSRSQHVILAIHTLRERFSEQIRVDELATIAQMSQSAFHRQFKALTTMSPLQYQKRLRLLEARRLIVFDYLNVETAAYKVGYESPSQFSREYSRMFGNAPKRDTVGIKGPLALA